jgi:flagellar protein FliL
MAEAAQPVDTKTRKSRQPLILGLLLALAGGGGGFFAMYSGALDSLLGGRTEQPEAGGHAAANEGGHGASDAPAAAHVAMTPAEIGFVALDPITINLGPPAQARHLRFSSQLEVPTANAAEVRRLMPRIMDVLNIYLRALDPHELEEPAALLRLRGQMLRRIQIVTGPGMVNDLLVMEFVFN